MFYKIFPFLLVLVMLPYYTYRVITDEKKNADWIFCLIMVIALTAGTFFYIIDFIF